MRPARLLEPELIADSIKDLSTMARSTLVTSTDYAHPHRPVPLRLFNGVGAVVGELGLRASLDPDSLLQAARRKTGLSDFGDPAGMEPLRVLADSVDREARLHALGRSIMRGRLVSTIANRLRIVALCREHPEIERIPIRRPSSSPGCSARAPRSCSA
jgi:hypothetical protein